MSLNIIHALAQVVEINKNLLELLNTALSCVSRSNKGRLTVQ